MKRVILTSCAAALLLASCANNAEKTEQASTTTTTTTSSNDNAKTEEWVPADSAAAVKAWMEYATPGEAHKALAMSDGNWTGESTMWMDASAAPVTSTTEATNKMMMDGRYQITNFKGSFMGMPFEGMGITGYDNHKKKYVSNWIDNMGTGMMQMEGDWDAATKTLTMNGKMADVATGKDCEMKEVFRITDADHHVLEMYGPDPKTGKQYKTMEVKFTRKK